MPKSGVFRNIFSTHLEETIWVGQKIKELLDSGVTPQNIAVIARKHSHLAEAVKVFHKLDIPINYERDENILEKPFIRQIITILRFVESLYKPNSIESQELLPEILSYPFWRLTNLDIYQISITANKNKQTWLEIMDSSNNSDIRNIADFLRELGRQAPSSSGEKILDEILGVSREITAPDQEVDENDDLDFISLSYNPELGILNPIETESQDYSKSLTKYVSPYKWFYFDNNYENSRSEYFTFLSGLRVFFTAIRGYKKKTVLKVTDILEFIDLMESNGLPLNDTSTFNQQRDTVCLLTAHKSKGLEFEYVFVINCLEKEWNGKKMVNKIGLPANLALLPETENIDDSLRLFFVALTRAKKYLYCSSAQFDDKGKELEQLSFLEGVELESAPETTKPSLQVEPLSTWLATAVQPRHLNLEEKSYLKPILENYKLSVTHLNNFLDLTHGGPQLFLEQNLLRFPQSKMVSGSYGTAMHAAVASLYRRYRETGYKPDLEYLLYSFEDALRFERLDNNDFKQYLEKGKSHLTAYYNHTHDKFNPMDKIEYDFKDQGVQLGFAKITGKIDKMSLTDNQFLVVDFKTGKSFDNWDTSNPDDKIKLDRYHRQLVFYKVLVENSRDFGGKYTVNEGCLEFLESNKKDGEIKSLSTQISQDEAQELSKLIQIVYKKIMNFDFEIALNYPQTYEGTKQFIQDLLSENLD